jgi:hypothetical protein
VALITDVLPSIVSVLSTTVPIVVAAIAVISAIVAMGRGKVKIGKLLVDFDRTAAASDIRARLDAAGTESGFRQYALLREYHAQGLAQSRVSFWFSLTFASIGFAVIALAIGLFLEATQAARGGLKTLESPHLPSFLEL